MTTRPSPADFGGIVTGWLIKIVVALALVGVVAYDAISITMARVTASDDARSIAQAASDALLIRSQSPERAVEAAMDRAETHGVVLGPKDLLITKDGTVTVHIRRSANTLVAYRIPRLKDTTQVDEIYTVPGASN